jgi:hypothetical protein
MVLETQGVEGRIWRRRWRDDVRTRATGLDLVDPDLHGDLWPNVAFPAAHAAAAVADVVGRPNRRLVCAARHRDQVGRDDRGVDQRVHGATVDRGGSSDVPSGEGQANLVDRGFGRRRHDVDLLYSPAGLLGRCGVHTQPCTGDHRHDARTGSAYPCHHRPVLHLFVDRGGRYLPDPEHESRIHRSRAGSATSPSGMR